MDLDDETPCAHTLPTIRRPISYRQPSIRSFRRQLSRHRDPYRIRSHVYICIRLPRGDRRPIAIHRELSKTTLPASATVLDPVARLHLHSPSAWGQTADCHPSRVVEDNSPGIENRIGLDDAVHPPRVRAANSSLLSCRAGAVPHDDIEPTASLHGQLALAWVLSNATNGFTCPQCCLLTDSMLTKSTAPPLATQ